MPEEEKGKRQPENEHIQFGEHIPKMMKVISTDLTKGQPVAAMQPVIVPPTSSQGSNSTSTDSRTTNTEKK